MGGNAFPVRTAAKVGSAGRAEPSRAAQALRASRTRRRSAILSHLRRLSSSAFIRLQRSREITVAVFRPATRRIMTHVARRARFVFLGAALTATIGCRRERPPVEELYTTRTLGLSYLQRNQLPEAEAEFKKLIRLAPDDAAGHADLGLTYMQAGRYAEAEAQLRRARRLDPGNVEIGLALAKLYSLTRRQPDARTTLEQLRRDTANSARVLHALAELDAQQDDSASRRRYEERLRDVLAIAPANLAVRLKLIDALARRGAADSAVRHLEEVRRIPPEPPPEARAYLDSVIQHLRAGDRTASRGALDRLLQLMEVTTQYQASLDEVRWAEGQIPGRLILAYAPKSFVSLTGVRDRPTVGLARFTDATSEAGFAATAAAVRPGGPTALAAGDVDGDGVDDLFVSGPGATGERAARLYRVQGGFVQDVTERSNVALSQSAAFATFADYDNDGWLDLFVIGGERRGHLFRNRGDATFTEVTARAAVADVRGAATSRFVDLDHDGDLDLLLVGESGRTVYRNNLDGTFSEATAAFGLAGGTRARDAAFAD